jgi:hypothetical protein
MDEMRLPQHIVSRIERRWAARLGQKMRPEQSARPPDARVLFPSPQFRILSALHGSQLGRRDSCPRTTV